MATQNVQGRDVAGTLAVAPNITTGAVTVGAGLTSGNVNIATNAATTGTVTIGDLGATTNTSILTGGAGQISVEHDSGGLSITSTEVSLAATGSQVVNVGLDTTTQNVNVGTSQTSGALNLGTGASRTGAINIGNGATATDINLRSQTGTISIGTDQTSGTVNIATNGSRTGAVTIGNSSSSATISFRTTGDVNVGDTGGTGTIALDTETGSMSIAESATTANITIGGSQTSGNFTAAGGIGRTGAIRIGEDNAGATGAMNLYAGSGDLTMRTTRDQEVEFLAAATRYKGGNVATEIADDNTTANVTVGNGLTSGTLDIGGGTSRTGTITIGDTSSTGNIDLVTTGSVNVSATASGGSVFIGHPSSGAAVDLDAGAGAIRIGNTSHSGVTQIEGSGAITIGNHSSAGAISIGHASATTGCTIEGGTGTLALNGSTITVETGTNAFYDEGSFTPVVEDAGGNAATLTTAIGRWTRLGERVWIDMKVTLSSKAGMTGTDQARFDFSGTPFKVENTSFYQPAGTVGFHSGITGGGTNDQLVCQVLDNQDWVRLFYVNNSTGATTAVTVDDLSSTAQLSLSFSFARE